MDEPVLSDVVEGHTLVVTLNRPEARNALSTPLKFRLAEVIDRFDRDDALTTMVLTGSDCA